MWTVEKVSYTFCGGNHNQTLKLLWEFESDRRYAKHEERLFNKTLSGYDSLNHDDMLNMKKDCILITSSGRHFGL